MGVTEDLLKEWRRITLTASAETLQSVWRWSIVSSESPHREQRVSVFEKCLIRCLVGRPLWISSKICVRRKEGSGAVMVLLQ